ACLHRDVGDPRRTRTERPPFGRGLVAHRSARRCAYVACLLAPTRVGTATCRVLSREPHCIAAGITALSALRSGLLQPAQQQRTDDIGLGAPLGPLHHLADE